MARHSRRRMGFCTGAAIAGLLVGGCPPGTPIHTSDNGIDVPFLGGVIHVPLSWTPPVDQKAGAALRPFASGDEMLAYFTVPEARSSGTGDGSDIQLGIVGLAAAPAAVGDATGAPEGATSYSTTNVQEEGVDEADVVKNDGAYLYIARGRTLRVVRAAPLAEMSEVGRVVLDGPVDSMYLLGTKLLVLGSGGAIAPVAEGVAAAARRPLYGSGLSVLISEVDIEDPSQPSVTAMNELDGSLVSSRVTGDRLVVVLSIAPPVGDDWRAIADGSVTLEAVLPQMRTAAGAVPLARPESWYHPTPMDGYTATGVVTLDAQDVTSVVGSVAVMANTGTVYASTEAVYLADAEYGLDYARRGSTTIHKLAFDEDGVAQYVASGSVPGRLLNQFSLGEYKDVLRVATQVQDQQPAGFVAGGTRQFFQHAVVSLLSRRGGALEIVGQIDNIAPGEFVHSSRFVGDHGFLVTYRKVDPLFVMDLSDPAAPRMLAELTIPGFSDYLHPLDDTHLIGVGKWTIPTDQGFDWYQGVQLSLFDVSDWSHPKAVQQLQFGGRGSECDVLETHKAFTFLPQQNLLALPMRLTTLNDIAWQSGSPEFAGVLLFHVDPAAGFDELGRIATVTAGGRQWSYGWPAWHRAAFIGDVAYAITPDGVRGAAVHDLANVAAILMGPENGENSGRADP